MMPIPGGETHWDEVREEVLFGRRADGRKRGCSTGSFRYGRRSVGGQCHNPGDCWRSKGGCTSTMLNGSRLLGGNGFRYSLSARPAQRHDTKDEREKTKNKEKEKYEWGENIYQTEGRLHIIESYWNTCRKVGAGATCTNTYGQSTLKKGLNLKKLSGDTFLPYGYVRTYRAKFGRKAEKKGAHASRRTHNKSTAGKQHNMSTAARS